MKDFEEYIISLNKTKAEDVDSLHYLANRAKSNGMGFIGIIDGKLLMTNVDFRGVDKDRLYPEEDGDGWVLRFKTKNHKGE